MLSRYRPDLASYIGLDISRDNLAQAIERQAALDAIHYAALLHLDIERPRAFCEHIAEQGIPNSTGSFRLVPLDQRPMFADETRPACATAAEFLNGILAVVLTRQDDQPRIRKYAGTITREVARWVNA